MITLLCTVRGCGHPLERMERTLRCGNGHSFDLARSGYANLLQPQERRSLRPGDRKEAIEARRRLLDRGYAAALFERLAGFVESRGEYPTVLDAGCGEGSHLGRLSERLNLECSGVDISTDAIELAARRYPKVTWIVANADRQLPYADGSFDVITSITARRNAAEFARVLREEGRLFIAVPAADDLAELRLTVQGVSAERSRTGGVVGELAGKFELESSEVVREVMELDHAALTDLLTATYRGVRYSERARVEALDRMRVTLAWEVMVFRRGAPAASRPAGGC